MGIKQIRERKKKQRERNSQEKVAKRRIALRADAKQKREVARIEKKTRFRQMPYISPEKKDAFIKSQLEYNLKVLDALEKEYGVQEETRKELQQELEAQGHKTLKEKLDALAEVRNAEVGIDTEEIKEEQRRLSIDEANLESLKLIEPDQDPAVLPDKLDAMTEARNQELAINEEN